MSDAEKALREIVALCEKSMAPTGRELEIFDLALRGLGLVESQRKGVIGNWNFNRLIAIRRASIERMAKKAAKAQALMVDREKADFARAIVAEQDGAMCETCVFCGNLTHTHAATCAYERAAEYLEAMP